MNEWMNELKIFFEKVSLQVICVTRGPKKGMRKSKTMNEINEWNGINGWMDKVI
jgi:hypothetical protein